MSDLTKLSLTDLSNAIRNQQVSSVELTRAVLGNIEKHDASINAYISVYADDALAQAKQAEAEIVAGNYRGPLHGIPMGLKDNLFFKDRTTTIGSRIHGDFVPQYNATVVEKLAESGVVFLGKHNLHEYALGVTTENPHFGTTRNPWNLTRIVGGSSGGAGASIPTGMSIGSLGSDTSGSIRIPAACCGIVGLKPTYGLVSKYGCFPEAWSLDHVGPMAMTVDDVATILDVISGHDAKDVTSLNRPATKHTGLLTGDVKGKVIGINEEFFFNEVDRDVADTVDHAIGQLEARGAILKKLDIPYIKTAEYAITIIDTSETTTVHHHSLQTRPQDFGEDVRFLVECGELPSAIDYLEAQQARARLQHVFQDVFDEVDALASPTLPIKTPGIGQATSDINGKPVDTVASLMRLVGPANLLGLPALSVPCGLLDEMPVGMQIIGPPLGEETVLNIGKAVEACGLFEIPEKLL